VLHDLEEGWITAERAQSVYGVATADSDEPGVPTLDESETQALRGRFRAA
jgi:hypothetical protein